MIFRKPEIVEAEERGGQLIVTQGQDIAPVLKLAHELREHDETKGFSRGRTIQHLASIPAIAFNIAMQQRPEVLLDRKAHLKWLEDDGPTGGKHFRVSKSAPVKGDGLQLIVKPGG